MRRREFITLVGGSAVIWPLAAHAQSGKGVRHVFMLMSTTENDPDARTATAAFRKSLEILGWTEGQNVHIDYRWAAGNLDRARASATEVAALAPDVIVTNGTQMLAAAQIATRTIPIVFVVVADPVGAGFVQNLAHPEANITGFSTFEPEIGGKWLELLKEMRPGLSRAAGIFDPSFMGFAEIWRVIEKVGPRSGVQVTSIALHNPADDIEPALAKFAQEPSGGLIVLPTPPNRTARDRIFALATRYRLPAVYPFRYYTTGGGLMSYGFDTLDLYRRSAAYVDRILKGEKPANLPVQAPTKYELVINVRAAKAIGLTGALLPSTP
jgi:ABC-type uncharacterized transport system substrate-binding protein